MFDAGGLVRSMRIWRPGIVGTAGGYGAFWRSFKPHKPYRLNTFSTETISVLAVHALPDWTRNSGLKTNVPRETIW